MAHLLILIVALGIILVFIQWPWLWLLAIAGTLLALLAHGLTRTDDYLTQKATGGLASVYLAIINPLRLRFGKAPIWLTPDLEYADRARIEQANRLYTEVKDALNHTPLSAIKKASFENQSFEVPRNIANAIWRLMRLRRLA